MIDFDLDRQDVRTLNARLHELRPGTNELAWKILNPKGRHSIAVGLTLPLEVEVDGHTGYYCGGMNQSAAIIVNGHCGPGVGENIMSGCIRVKGNASQGAGASGHGGMIVIEGDASARCGISMKGVDIVVGGSVGHMSAFMAQAGRLVVCGDAGADLGDSIYEAVIYVQGKVQSLGSDCVEQDMTASDLAGIRKLLRTAKMDADADGFRRYGSARQLYNFHVDHASKY